MIDLHTHTNESDGTYTPEQLVTAAADMGLSAIAITDHDTFAGYDAAREHAQARGFDLLCGIELSTLLFTAKSRKTVHVLGYFPNGAPEDLRAWLAELHAARRDRNVRLAERLRSLGVDIKVEEVEALGRSIAGRPHFARLMINKGYVTSIPQAFDQYIGEAGKAFVERDGPSVEEGIERVRKAGGVTSLAHPIRLGMRDAQAEEALIERWRDAGLDALEAIHSDHSPSLVSRYSDIARRHGMAVTGGSDFHGEVKPNVRLGQMQVPDELLENLRRLPAARVS